MSPPGCRCIATSLVCTYSTAVVGAAEAAPGASKTVGVKSSINTSPKTGSIFADSFMAGV